MLEIVILKTSKIKSDKKFTVTATKENNNNVTITK